MGSIPIRQSLWFNMDKTQISIMVGITRALRSCRGLPNYIWLFRLLARISGSHPEEGAIDTPKSHQGKANIPVNQMRGRLT